MRRRAPAKAASAVADAGGADGAPQAGAALGRGVSDERPPGERGYLMPAEWEPHRGTIIAWPHNADDWPGIHGAIPAVFTQIARWVTRSERLRVLVRGARDEAAARAAFGDAGVDLRRVTFQLAPTNRSWTRDSMPIGLRAADDSRSEVAVKFRFDGWHRYDDHERDDAAGFRVGRALGAPLLTATLAGSAERLVLEGGAIDTDGAGTFLVTERCLFRGRYARNRRLGAAGWERELGRWLGARRVIWLEDGVAGDDTSGHVDDFARFVHPGCVVLAHEPDRKDANHRPLAAARERLEGARDAEGRRLEVVPLPMPAPVYHQKVRLPASYANFYVTSDAVLVPTFDDPADRTALGVLGELFPDRVVTGIHCRELVVGLGSIHCSTMQEL